MAGLASLLWVLWVGVSTSSVVDLQKRIIRGQTCPSEERLYHVEVRASLPDGRFRFCGGSLISAKWVLTAEHCWDTSRTMRAVLGVHPGPGTAESVTPHFFLDHQGRRHDIMLLELRRSTRIRPVPLPDARDIAEVGAVIQVAGRGATAGGPNGEREPDRAATLHCASAWTVLCPPLPPPRAFQHVFCGQSPGVDVCEGDSGGGVVFNGRIYGVIAFIFDNQRVCRDPFGFTKVFDYLPWINQKISGHRGG